MGTTSIFIICILVFGIGIIVGGLLFKEFSPEQKKARNIIKHLHEKQDDVFRGKRVRQRLKIK